MTEQEVPAEEPATPEQPDEGTEDKPEPETEDEDAA